MSKRNNLDSTQGQPGRRRLLTKRDVRAMERILIENKVNKSIKTPLAAVKAINKTVREWTARRALGDIGLMAPVNPKNQLCQKKNVISPEICKKS